MSSYGCADSCRLLAAIYRTYERMCSEGVDHIQDTRSTRLMHNFGRSVRSPTTIKIELLLLCPSSLWYLTMAFGSGILSYCPTIPFSRDKFTRNLTPLLKYVFLDLSPCPIVFHRLAEYVYSVPHITAHAIVQYHM